MPVKRMPCLTMRKSWASVQSSTVGDSSGGTGSMARTAEFRGTPGAPWQNAQPSP